MELAGLLAVNEGLIPNFANEENNAQSVFRAFLKEQ